MNVIVNVNLGVSMVEISEKLGNKIAVFMGANLDMGIVKISEN